MKTPWLPCPKCGEWFATTCYTEKDAYEFLLKAHLSISPQPQASQTTPSPFLKFAPHPISFSGKTEATTTQGHYLKVSPAPINFTGTFDWKMLETVAKRFILLVDVFDKAVRLPGTLASQAQDMIDLCRSIAEKIRGRRIESVIFCSKCGYVEIK